MGQKIFGPNPTDTQNNDLVVNDDGSIIITGAAAATTLTVTGGDTVSGVLDLEGNCLVALEMRFDWDGGNITIQSCSTIGGTFLDVYASDGTIVTVTAAASHMIGLSGTHLQAVSALRYIKLRTASAPAATRTITVIAKG